MTLAAEFPNDNPDLHEGVIWVCLDVTGLPVAERRAPVLAVVAPIETPIETPIDEAIVEAIVEPTFEAIAAPITTPIVEPVIEAEPPPVRESGIFMVETFSSLEDDLDDEGGEILVEELGPLEDAILEEVVAVEPAVAEAAPVAIEEPVVVEQPVVVEEIVAEAAQPKPEPVTTVAPPPPDDAFVVFVSTLVDVAIANGASAAASELPAMLDADKTAQAWAGILRGTSEDWDAVGGSMLDEWAADTLARATGVDAQTLKRDLRTRGIAAFGLAA